MHRILNFQIISFPSPKIPRISLRYDTKQESIGWVRNKNCEISKKRLTTNVVSLACSTGIPRISSPISSRPHPVASARCHVFRAKREPRSSLAPPRANSQGRCTLAPNGGVPRAMKGITGVRKNSFRRLHVAAEGEFTLIKFFSSRILPPSLPLLFFPLSRGAVAGSKKRSVPFLFFSLTDGEISRRWDGFITYTYTLRSFVYSLFRGK